MAASRTTRAAASRVEAKLTVLASARLGTSGAGFNTKVKMSLAIQC